MPAGNNEINAHPQTYAVDSSRPDKLVDMLNRTFVFRYHLASQEQGSLSDCNQCARGFCGKNFDYLDGRRMPVKKTRTFSKNPQPDETLITMAAANRPRLLRSYEPGQTWCGGADEPDLR